MSAESQDPVMALLSRLPQAEPRAAATERVRARCHGVLDRQKTRRAPAPRGPGARLIDATLLVSAGLYLIVSVGAAIGLMR